MGRDKVIGVEEALEVVLDGDTVATGGFVGIGFPEHLAAALERRFLRTGEVHNRSGRGWFRCGVRA